VGEDGDIADYRPASMANFVEQANLSAIWIRGSVVLWSDLQGRIEL
jgi:hypothetical protein